MRVRVLLAGLVPLLLAFASALGVAVADTPAGTQSGSERPLPRVVSLLARACETRRATPSARFVEQVKANRSVKPGWKVFVEGTPAAERLKSAQSLAAGIGAPILRVDLQAVVSKYIGETEKNLNQLLARAEESNAVLLFDEADELFGKRTDVADANDRYANLDLRPVVARLLAYEGVVILVTKGAISAEVRQRIVTAAHAVVRVGPGAPPIWDRVCWPPAE